MIKVDIIAIVNFNKDGFSNLLKIQTICDLSAARVKP